MTFQKKTSIHIPQLSRCIHSVSVSLLVVNSIHLKKLIEEMIANNPLQRPNINDVIKRLPTCNATSQLNGHTDDVWRISWNPRSNLLATGSLDRTARIWNVDSKETSFITLEQGGTVCCIDWNVSQVLSWAWFIFLMGTRSSFTVWRDATRYRLLGSLYSHMEHRRNMLTVITNVCRSITRQMER